MSTQTASEETHLAAAKAEESTPARRPRTYAVHRGVVWLSAVVLLAVGAAGTVAGWQVVRQHQQDVAASAALEAARSYAVTLTTTDLGAIDLVATPLSYLSPFRLLNIFFDAHISNTVLAAGVISFPANLGSTMCLQAVQVYINRTVPADRQGGIFGLQQVQENALNLIVIILLGALAAVTGPQYIFLVAPFIVVAIALALIAYSSRHTTGKTPHLSESIDFLIEDVPPQTIENVDPTHQPERPQSPAENDNTASQ